MSSSRTVSITNKRGLHARASAKFVTLAASLPAAVEVMDALAALIAGRFGEDD